MKFTNLPEHKKTTTIIAILGQDREFLALSASELKDLANRDKRDNKELLKGIRYSNKNGDLPVLTQQKQWEHVNVGNRDPQAIVADILTSIPSTGNTNIAISGDSGIGKSTIAMVLEAAMPGSAIWSNGLVFRAITYLFARQTGKDIRIVNRRNAEAISSVAKQLSIDPDGTILVENNGKIQAVDSTHLHQPTIDRLVPAVARYCQGPVIRLANQFLSSRELEGNVIVEGRKATLVYINADIYIELLISDRAMLGKRRVAQRVLQGLNGLPVQDNVFHSLVTKAEWGIKREWEM